MKFSHICPLDVVGGLRRSVGGGPFVLRSLPYLAHHTRPAPGHDRMAHGLIRTDSRDTLAAHQVWQDPNGVEQARIAPASQATGEWQYSAPPRAGSQVRSVSCPTHRPSRPRIFRRSSRTSSLDSSCSGTSMSAMMRAGRSDRTTTRWDRRRASSTSWGDQDGREALGLPQLDDLVLELEACQRRRACPGARPGGRAGAG